jgi:hypothetical protein
MKRACFSNIQLDDNNDMRVPYDLLNKLLMYEIYLSY